VRISREGQRGKQFDTKVPASFIEGKWATLAYQQRRNRKASSNEGVFGSVSISTLVVFSYISDSNSLQQSIIQNKECKVFRIMGFLQQALSRPEGACATRVLLTTKNARIRQRNNHFASK